jgi:hypothetical protein
MAGGVPQAGIVFEVCAVASYYPDESRSSDEGGESCPRLPSRASGAERANRRTEARAELRDRETYYLELRLAVYGQCRSILRPRAALTGRVHQDVTADGGSAAGEHRASGARSADGEIGAGGKFSAGRTMSSADGKIRSDGESWGDMTARYGDTWT